MTASVRRGTSGQGERSLTASNDGATGVRRLVRQGWEKVATEHALDRMDTFERSGWRLLKLARPAPGGKLLDVGTGTRAVAFQARVRIGSEGLVMGSAWISPPLPVRP